jgi:hypothetical protein
VDRADSGRAAQGSRAADRVAQADLASRWEVQSRRRLTLRALAGYGVSLVLHLVALLVFALIVFPGIPSDGMVIFGGLAKERPAEELEGLLDSKLDTAEAPPTELVVRESPLVTLEPVTPLSGTGSEEEANQEGGGNDGLSPNINVPSFAVTKGSFSVWTEPKDPNPGQNYRIVISVKLPTNVRAYRTNDLSGLVIGTDGYRLQIQKGLKEALTPAKLTPVDGAVQVRVAVPGARKLVRDTIEVKSKFLKEEQQIEIEF